MFTSTVDSSTNTTSPHIWRVGLKSYLHEYTKLTSNRSVLSIFSLRQLFATELFPFDKSSSMFMLQLLMLYCETIFLIHFCCIETIAFTYLTASESLCIKHHWIVTAYYSFIITRSAHLWLLWGWGSIWPLLTEVTGWVYMYWPQIQIQDRFRTRPVGKMAQHWPQVAITINILQHSYCFFILCWDYIDDQMLGTYSCCFYNGLHCEMSTTAGKMLQLHSKLFMLSVLLHFLTRWKYACVHSTIKWVNGMEKKRWTSINAAKLYFVCKKDFRCTDELTCKEALEQKWNEGPYWPHLYMCIVYSSTHHCTHGRPHIAS